MKPLKKEILGQLSVPAAFRRLCVETDTDSQSASLSSPSRLQAAVC